MPDRKLSLPLAGTRRIDPETRDLVQDFKPAATARELPDRDGDVLRSSRAPGKFRSNGADEGADVRPASRQDRPEGEITRESRTGALKPRDVDADAKSGPAPSSSTSSGSSAMFKPAPVQRKQDSQGRRVEVWSNGSNKFNADRAQLVASDIRPTAGAGTREHSTDVSRAGRPKPSASQVLPPDKSLSSGPSKSLTASSPSKSLTRTSPVKSLTGAGSGARTFARSDRAVSVIQTAGAARSHRAGGSWQGARSHLHDPFVQVNHWNAVSGCGHTVCSGRPSCAFVSCVRDPWLARPRSSFSFSVSFGSFWDRWNSCGGPCWDDCGWWRSSWCSPCRPAFFCHRRPLFRSVVFIDRLHCDPFVFQPVYFASYNSYPVTAYDGFAGAYEFEPLPSYESFSGYGSDLVPVIAADGWDLLAQNDLHEARRAFDRMRGLYPDDGLQQIGYAIAAGLLGRRLDAADAMRIAMQSDPQALNEVPQRPEIQDRVDELLQDTLDWMAQQPGERDALFMASALRAMRGEYALAYYLADQAMERGDRSAAALNLKRLVEDAMQP